MSSRKYPLSATSPLTIEYVDSRIAGLAVILAGDGLTKTGDTINAIGTANRISVSADAINISTAYIGQSTITTLGTITTGVWTGTNIARSKLDFGSGLVNADVDAAAEIAVSKLADGAANDVLVTNADGVTVNWVSGLTASHLASDAVTTAKILDANVTSAKLASGLTLAGQTLLADGAAGTPALAFASDTNTGIFTGGDNVFNFVTGGVTRATLRSTSYTLTVPVLAPIGSNTAPAYAFSVDTNTGMYQVTTDQIGFATGGTIRATIDSTGLSVSNGLSVGVNSSISGSTTMHQSSLSANSWAALMQMTGAAQGDRYLILAQSGIGGTVDTEFYVTDGGQARCDGTFTGGGADYAEWFAHDAPLVPGDVAGLNLLTGKVRKLVLGDPIIGVCSENPAFAAGHPSPIDDDPLKKPSGYSLIGLVGKVTIDPAQVDIEAGIVFAKKSTRRIGYALPNGKVFVNGGTLA